jgi:hypothetical protein
MYKICNIAFGAALFSAGNLPAAAWHPDGRNSTVIKLFIARADCLLAASDTTDICRTSSDSPGMGPDRVFQPIDLHSDRIPADGIKNHSAARSRVGCIPSICPDFPRILPPFLSSAIRRSVQVL